MDFLRTFSKEESSKISKEFKRLDSLVYLDHTGSCLYPQSLIEAVSKDLCSNTYSNPHSNSTCSRATSDSIDQVRFRILQHFNTNQNEYSVIFTSGATAALKLVAEAFDWSPPCESNTSEWHPRDAKCVQEKGNFVYLNDSHTSVLGMRSLAEERGVSVTCLSHEKVFTAFKDNVEPTVNKNYEGFTNSLFVYPAQCNFSGLKYPLNWIEKTHEGSLNSLFSGRESKWYCLLDAATFLSTSSLDLNSVKPDFVCMSFYKMFGYPTGLGALLVKNSSSDVLLKRYYGGGTVQIAFSSKNSFVPRPLLHDKFEDGTLNFLSILSIHHCFNILYQLVGNMERVSRHSFLLAKYAFESMLKLHHSNGLPAVELYTDTCYDESCVQGGIITFNLLRPNSEYVGFVEVLHQANLHNIQLRTGCFCNSGACWRHLNLSPEEVKSQYKAGHVCGDDMDLVDGRPTGAVRISFGYYTYISHIDHFLDMINNCFVEQPAIHKIPQYWTEKSHVIKERLQNNPIFFKEKLGSATSFKQISNTLTNGRNIGHYIESNSTMDLKISAEPVLSHIFLYPVKSCGSLSVSSWVLDSKGLMYDRMWMIVNSSGVALTQKREPTMCLIKPNIDLEARKLTLSFQGKEFSLPLNSDVDMEEWTGTLCQSKVCGDRIEGYDCGDKVSLWLSEILDTPGLRLVQQHSRSSKKSLLSLANQGQYLLVSNTSVSWLCDQISSNEFNKETFLDRFRSNFVIKNIAEPFVEQGWSKVTIGDFDFKVDGGCNRCHMICIDQNTGVSNQEPLTALGNAMQGKLKFGVYLSRMGSDSVGISNKQTNYEK